MRPVHWIHISDFHLRESKVWSQDAVLIAMLDDIKRRVAEGITFDFVLATGDLAFSGQENQYVLVEAFIEELATAINLTHDKIFCVPGNHDVNRDRQTKCFIGAQSTLKNQSDVYSFLSSEEERETLLTRQHSFRQFQERCFSAQAREWTDDGLGYVSVIDVDDIKIAIIGLNSAWLAKGGVSDQGRILLGESQVIKAIEITKQADPHIVIGMAHHPFTLLSEFDRSSTQPRLENICNFFHCGHLHVPNASNTVAQSSRCLTLAAGASFESREASNSYTVVSFDPLNAQTDVTFVNYDPTKGTFSFYLDKSYTHQFDGVFMVSINELADALGTYCPDVIDFSHYLAGLLVEWIAEVPILTDRDVVVFGTVSLLQQQPESRLKAATFDFFTVGNAMKLLSKRKPLEEILSSNGQPVARYVTELIKLSETNADLRAQLIQRNELARKMVAVKDSAKQFSHILELLKELRNAKEWDALHQQAERYIGLKDPLVVTCAKRSLALCLARSADHLDRNRALALYQELLDSLQCEAEDFASLATLLSNEGNYKKATETIWNGIEAFPQNIDGFVGIGMKIVEATGNRDLRKRLMDRSTERRSE